MLVPVFRLVGINDLGSTTGVDQYIRFPDHTTGIAQVVGGLGGSFNQVDGMAVLSGLGQDADRIFGADNGRLVAINPATGAATPIGPIGFSQVDGLCFHPQTRELFGVTYGSNKILRINTSTGRGTVVASNVLAGHRLNDVAFSPDGRMFIITDGSPKLYQVNPATGAKIKKWVLSGGTSLESLAWSPDGATLYSAADRGGFKDLVRIALLPGDVGTISFVSPQHSGFRDIEALAWIRDTPAPIFVQDLPNTKTAPTAVSGLRLLQNVPNPFNPTTRIAFVLAQAGSVELSVHDVAGRRVATLLHGPMSAGQHEVDWTGLSDHGIRASSGVYFYTLRAGQHVEQRRMLLVQ